MHTLELVLCQMWLAVLQQPFKGRPAVALAPQMSPRSHSQAVREPGFGDFPEIFLLLISCLVPLWSGRSP